MSAPEVQARRTRDWAAAGPALITLVLAMIGGATYLLVGFIGIRDDVVKSVVAGDQKTEAVRAEAKSDNALQNQRLDEHARAILEIRSTVERLASEIRGTLADIQKEVVKTGGDVRELNALSKSRDHRR